MDSPASAAAPYSQGQKRVALLVHALASAQVFSRAALARAFARDPAFLKEELQAWLQKVSVAHPYMCFSHRAGVVHAHLRVCWSGECRGGPQALSMGTPCYGSKCIGDAVFLMQDAREALASIWPTLLVEAHSPAGKKGAQHVGKRKHSVT